MAGPVPESAEGRSRLGVVAESVVAQQEPHPTDQGLRLPTAGERLRCAGCGNLTRFDVTLSARVTEYWHFDLPGEHEVENTTVHEQRLDEVVCRWCGRSDAIEVVARPM